MVFRPGQGERCPVQHQHAVSTEVALHFDVGPHLADLVSAAERVRDWTPDVRTEVTPAGSLAGTASDTLSDEVSAAPPLMVAEPVGPVVSMTMVSVTGALQLPASSPNWAHTVFVPSPAGSVQGIEAA